MPQFPSERQALFLFLDLEEADKPLGTKALLLCPKSETEAVSIIFGPGPVLTTLIRAAQKLWGVINILHATTLQKVVTVSFGLIFYFFFLTNEIINTVHIISLIFKMFSTNFWKNP